MYQLVTASGQTITFSKLKENLYNKCMSAWIASYMHYIAISLKSILLYMVSGLYMAITACMFITL